MTIIALDKELKSVVDNYSVYGVECIISSLIRACRDKRYLEPDVIKRILDHVIEREKEDAMKLNERRYYEAALILCLGFKEEGAETSIAIEKTIEVLKDIVCDVKDLRNYLTTFIY